MPILLSIDAAILSTAPYGDSSPVHPHILDPYGYCAATVCLRLIVELIQIVVYHLLNGTLRVMATLLLLDQETNAL